MTDARTLRRDVVAAWDAVRRDRRVRRKLIAEAELSASAAMLRAHADAFDALAKSAAEIAVDDGAPADGAPTLAKKKATPAKAKAKSKTAKRLKAAKKKK